MQLFLNASASLLSKSSRLIPKTDTQNVTLVCSNLTPKILMTRPLRVMPAY